MSSSLRPLLRETGIASQKFPPPTTSYICLQCRHARLLRRPKRPYTFTQLVTLSDGSAFTMRTTSPQPVYRCTRDTRNAPLWNPSSKALQNVEEDEAGRLSGFRARFGTGFDANKDASPLSSAEEEGQKHETSAVKNKKRDEEEPEDEFGEDDMNLLDLISSFGQEQGLQSGGKGGKIK